VSNRENLLGAMGLQDFLDFRKALP
jgi:hypothetical protein